MLKFIKKNCPNGFVRKKGHVKTPRVRYEALSVGTALALQAKPKLKVVSMDWVNDETDAFHKMATAGSSNSRPKIKRRIEYVRLISNQPNQSIGENFSVKQSEIRQSYNATGKDTTMNKFVARKWEAIEDLPLDWLTSLANSQTKALVDAWLEQKDELQEKGVYKDFLGRLKREWSIETGIIEGLYTLTEGATKTLIEKGLDASFLARGDTDDEPQNVIAKIEDHQSAINGLYDFVSGHRQLCTSYIKELHVVLTDHQRTYQARDTLGNSVVRDLPRGEWKRLKNNVEHVDGAVFEFCPSEHVDQEMDNLVSMHLRHVNEGVPADIEAAWLHHRFSIIHPFTDGNGRVARCIATMVLLRESWLPLVVTRQDRDKYIEALRYADAGPTTTGRSLRPQKDLGISPTLMSIKHGRRW